MLSSITAHGHHRPPMSYDLDNLAVYGATPVGWDANTPINETVDEDGNPFPIDRGFGVPDPYAPARRVHDHPEVEELRAHLEVHNGMRGLEICAPEEVYRAARIFRRDGFVVVRDLLDPEQLGRWREGCARVLRQILAIPGRDGRKYVTETGRLPHRYSYGTSSASRQLLHEPEWAAMIELPTTRPILEAIFGSAGYRVVGAGGDLCLPGAIEYQHLHADIQDDQRIDAGRLAQARQLGIDVPDGELDFATARMILERTPPLVTINFLMSDLTWENGPTRQIPGTHASVQRPPSTKWEPAWMKTSTLVGAKAGDGVFRDNRAWHGATPNLSREIRALPNVEYGAPWFTGWFGKTMPHEIWQTLSPYAQHLARDVVSEPGVWPAGAGLMHPLLNERRRIKSRARS